jgi:hypothetical protein
MRAGKTAFGQAVARRWHAKYGGSLGRVLPLDRLHVLHDADDAPCDRDPARAAALHHLSRVDRFGLRVEQLRLLLTIEVAFSDGCGELLPYCP